MAYPFCYPRPSSKNEKRTESLIATSIRTSSFLLETVILRFSSNDFQCFKYCVADAQFLLDKQTYPFMC